MTYCLAMKLSTGLVFLSDSRTNAGIDHIATFRKMYRFTLNDRTAVVLLAAGNLGTTQHVIDRLKKSTNEENWLNSSDIHDMATHVGKTLNNVISEYQGLDGIDFRANFIFGGQVRGQRPELFHIYPEGNFIAATVDTPYFLIGESKYGKPIIDRIVKYETDLDTATRCALISMDSTIRSNLSVGLPLDLLRYDSDSFTLDRHTDITEHHEGFQQLRKAWSEGIQQAFEQLPDCVFFNESNHEKLTQLIKR